MEVYIVLEEYGSPWTGQATNIHKAFANEEAANKYSIEAKALYGGTMEVIPIDLIVGDLDY
jgi:hypothetical protein